jgi:hypothetical protein
MDPGAIRLVVQRLNHCATPGPHINEETAMKFEQEYIRCVRNEEECVYSVSVVHLIVVTWSSGQPASRVR